MIKTYAELTAAVVKWLKDPKLADIAPDIIQLAEAQFRRTIKYHDREGTVTINARDVLPATLIDLTLSTVAAVVNRPFAIAIIGKAPGSVVSASSNDLTAITINGAVITGTFTTLGSPTLTLTETLSDAANSPHVSPPITLTVVNPIAISGTPPAGSVDAPYSFVPTVSGGYGPRSLQLSGALLAGLSFDVTTGAITGTPTLGGVMNLTITVSDAVDTDTHSVTINVSEGVGFYAQYAAILEDF